MKRFTMLLLFLAASAVPALAQAPPPIPGPGETVTWTAEGGPYRLSRNATIPASSTVFVDPGASVHIDDGATLFVAGSLLGAGTASERIILRSDTNFPPSVEVTGALVLAFADLSGQMRPLDGASFELTDCSFSVPGGVMNFSGSTFPFVKLVRCVFTGASIELATATLVLQDVLVDGSFLRSSTLFRMDGVEVRNSPFQGFILSNRLQPAYLNRVSAVDCAGPGFEIFGGGDFFFGPDNVIQGNEYPVEMFSSAGIARGSVLPGSGNRNDFILGPGDGDARFAQATWSNAGIPYLVPGNVAWLGGLDIEPGTTIRFEETAGLSVQASNFFRGLPELPIRFEPAIPGGQWFAVGFTREGSGLEYCHIDGGGITVAVTPAAHMENCLLRNSSNGLSPGLASDWFVSGTRFLDNPVGAKTNTGMISGGGLHLDNPTNPNAFEGNVAAIQDVTPNGTALNDAESVWWGDPTGPQHPTNPGGQGDPIIGSGVAPVAKVDFDPWLTEAPSFDNHAPVVRLQTPHFLWEPGSRAHLRWSARDDDSIVEQRILFNAEGNFSFDTVVAVLPGTQRSFEWTIPDVGFLFNPPSFLRVVAIDESGKEGWDQTAFTIPSGENPSRIVFTQQPPPLVRPGDELEVC